MRTLDPCNMHLGKVIIHPRSRLCLHADRRCVPLEASVDGASSSRLFLSRQQSINDERIRHEQPPCIKKHSSLLLACNDVIFAVQYGAFEDHNSIVLVEEYASMVSQDMPSPCALWQDVHVHHLCLMKAL